MALTKEEKRAYNQAYYKKNRERLIADAKRYYAENRESGRAARAKWYAANKDRASDLGKKWYQKNRDHVLEREKRKGKLYRFTKHGMTEQDYQNILDSQDGVCAICSKECSLGGSLSIDHDHATGKVRGLLCRKCNSGLGFFKGFDRAVELGSELLEGASMTEPDHRRKPPIFSWYFEDLAVAVLNVLYWDADGNWGVADEVLS